MPKDKEQSAIDAIFEILNEVQKIHQEIAVINNNIKILNNKFSKLNQEKVSASIPNQSKELIKTNADKNEFVKVFGRIKNQNKNPMPDVRVIIYDPKGSIVKSRVTDSDGYWEARLTPGQYVVELNATHINKIFAPQNINITLKDDMKEYEVLGRSGKK